MKIKNKSLEKYFQTERELIYQANKYKSNVWFDKRKEFNTDVIENIGNIALFSVSDAAYCFKKLLTKGAFENKNYVEKIHEQLKSQGNRKRFASPSIDQLINLGNNFPNFNKAVEHIKGSVALANITKTSTFKFEPMLICGPPGVGKTVFVQELASISNNDFTRIDIGSCSMGSKLVGLSLNWSTGETGEIFNLLTASDYINPIIMLDELDKVVFDNKFPIEPALLSLLEQESSESFRDEAIPIKLDASNIIWIATCNDINSISKPILSRFNVIHIDPPSEIQMRNVILRIYLKLLSKNKCDGLFDQKLSDKVVDRLIKIPPRSVLKVLQTMLGRAALQERTFLSEKDIIEEHSTKKSKIGFF